MLEQNKMLWDEFLAGHWTESFPSKPGYYPVNVIAGQLSILVYHNFSTNQLESSQPWNDYWWSVPLPNLVCQE